MDTVWWPTWVFADWSFAAHVAKVPDAVLAAANNVVVLGRLADQSEGLVFAAEKETGLVASVHKIAVISAGDWGRDAAVNSWAGGRSAG